MTAALIFIAFGLAGFLFGRMLYWKRRAMRHERWHSLGDQAVKGRHR